MGGIDEPVEPEIEPEPEEPGDEAPSSLMLLDPERPHTAVNPLRRAVLPRPIGWLHDAQIAVEPLCGNCGHYRAFHESGTGACRIVWADDCQAFEG